MITFIIHDRIQNMPRYSERVKKVLKLDRDNEDKEIEFELGYLLSLSVQQRFEMMFKKSKEISELLIQNGHRKSDKVIKRK